MLATNADGDQTEGFQVHLGGSLGTSNSEGEFGRSVKGMKLPAEELNSYVNRLVDGYLADRTEGETFAQWTSRADEATLK